ncbi:catalytic phage domain protein : Integrase, catalytic core, phage domain protein OS=Rhodopirellula sallentina SM41 GN=RSSM_06627 PE=4 SV=1: Phage_integrase [Gemmata massiliana]|uniref:Tyr recombinase domain-containing protein n=1 Tax=Gemmata massiliana TaxID=1210884 RepID=A0A6P2D971_9BACT|nr:site-specific integrase [Gemmata massiliana]VTR97901.1 catalytic phage domain protein : Integrase, catalytic core, phage domain protein OS=Rhodopirellula sallentina SM41 GN=RSSM_06627 PE=4 SV=1: Phage_integrase [Gemmata massiliana]
MARPKNHTPTYKKHSSTGLARCWVTLGKYGSPESRAEFARIIAELATSPTPQIGPISRTGTPPAALLTIDQMLLAFLAHAERYYRGRDGEPTDEVREIRRSLLYVHKLYGHTPAAEFGPRALAAARQQMISADWCRTLINRRVERIKRAFKWAASQELVPVTMYDALRTLQGLQKGRTTAREAEPVKPVDLARVRATLPFLTAHVRAMVELQHLTGMRPGEVCALALADIDRTGDTWLYHPPFHKTAHHGKDRLIPIGPKARVVLEAFLSARVIDPAAPLFSPALAREEWGQAARAKRKSKVPPAQMNRRVSHPKKGPGTAYTVTTYGKAIRKAAERAGLPSWHPNQLRHTFATEVRKHHGLEAAQVLLGHSRADVTQVYSKRNLALALKVAAEIG